MMTDLALKIKGHDSNRIGHRDAHHGEMTHLKVAKTARLVAHAALRENLIRVVAIDLIVSKVALMIGEIVAAVARVIGLTVVAVIGRRLVGREQVAQPVGRDERAIERMNHVGQFWECSRRKKARSVRGAPAAA